MYHVAALQDSEVTAGLVSVTTSIILGLIAFYKVIILSLDADAGYSVLTKQSSDT
jgi:hypothetical protein